MKLQFECPKCFHEFELNEHFSEARIPCPKCGLELPILEMLLYLKKPDKPGITAVIFGALIFWFGILFLFCGGAATLFGVLFFRRDLKASEVLFFHAAILGPCCFIWAGRTLLKHSKNADPGILSEEKNVLALVPLALLAGAGLMILMFATCPP